MREQPEHEQITVRPVCSPDIPDADRLLIEDASSELLRRASEGGEPRRRRMQSAYNEDWIALGIVGFLLFFAIFAGCGIGSLADHSEPFTGGRDIAGPISGVLLATLLPIWPRKDRNYATLLAGHRWHGQYLTGDDFDETVTAVLDRARVATDTITGSEAYRRGILPTMANEAVLRDQIWDIASKLATHTRIRRQDRGFDVSAPEVRAALEPQHEVLANSAASVEARVAGLEALAADVVGIDQTLQVEATLEKVRQRGDDLLDLAAAEARDELGRREVDELAAGLPELRAQLQSAHDNARLVLGAPES